MPRPLLDSVKNGRSFAASASRDRFAPFGLAFGEVSLASLGAFPLAKIARLRIVCGIMSHVAHKNKTDREDDIPPYLLLRSREDWLLIEDSP